MDKVVSQFETNFRASGDRQALARQACWRGAWDCVAGGRPLVAVVPGAFRPPHRGHMDMVARLARCCSGVVVVVRPDTDGSASSCPSAPGGGRRIPASLAVEVWSRCLPYVLPEELAGHVAVVDGDLRQACAQLSGRCEVVLVAGQEAMGVRPGDCPHPYVLLPREAAVSSTAMATVPLWTGPCEDGHVAYIADFLPAALPLQLATEIARSIALSLCGGSAGQTTSHKRTGHWTGTAD